MTYQVLARKWRPQDFSSLIGQEAIVTALRNALSQERIAQAYVFSGIRGVGKTTAARVFAKALNCEGGEDPNRPTPDPCNECGPCLDITSGRDVDVQEIDAATYSKVEQVRELTESLRYGTARDRYKVVILDEVHRLSRQAFDALLKIVEEPPPHLVFLFATTELDAVPATILSRCQEFQFRRVPSSVLAEHLRNISEAENIEVGDASLRMIARAGEGSVRDSVALLDQMATFGDGKITDEDSRRLLGGLDAAIFHQTLQAILQGDHSPILAIIAEIEANGWDPHNVYSQFLSYVRSGLHLSLGGEVGKTDLPLEEAEALAALVRGAGYEALLRLTQNLLSAEPMVKRSEMSILAVEIAWLRAAEMPKLVRIEDLLAGRAEANLSAVALDRDRSPAFERRRIASPSVSSPPSTVLPSTVPAPSASPSKSTPLSKPTVSSSMPVESTSSEDGQGFDLGSMDDFVEAVGRKRRPLKSRLQKAQLKLDGRSLEIKGDPATVKAVERGREIIQKTSEEIFGPGISLRIKESKESAPQSASPTSVARDEPRSESPRRESPKESQRKKSSNSERPSQESGSSPSSNRTSRAVVVDEAVSSHPTVRSIMELFDGAIRGVRPIEEPSDESESNESES